MREPIFARTRTHYDSYQDFWRLVELAGFRTCYVDEIRLDTDATYIVTPVNGEVRPHLENERMRVIHAGRVAWLVVWALERPDSPTARPWKDEVTDLLSHFDEVWVSDGSLERLDPRARFVPMGSDSRLGRPGDPNKLYDVAFMGYMVPRRDGVAHALRQRGISIAPNGWGVERAATLAKTRIMLNVHQHNNPAPIGEPLRIALAAAFTMSLVSETIADPYPLAVGLDFAMAPLEELAACVQALLAHPAQMAGLGENLYVRLCLEHHFEFNVRRALGVS